jgi:SNF2 family DNA or RNA helicase
MIWQSDIKCVQLNGAMNITEKGRAIDIFTHDADYRVFLMSLKAGGVALNLTVASHVSLANLISLPTFAQQKFLKLAVNSTGGGDNLFF